MPKQPSTQPRVTTPPSEATLHKTYSQDVQPENEKAEPITTDDDKFQKQPLTTVVALIVTSLMAMFLIALDRTIITTVRKHGSVCGSI